MSARRSGDGGKCRKTTRRAIEESDRLRIAREANSDIEHVYVHWRDALGLSFGGILRKSRQSALRRPGDGLAREAKLLGKLEPWWYGSCSHARGVCNKVYIKALNGLCSCLSPYAFHLPTQCPLNAYPPASCIVHALHFPSSS